VVTNARAFYSTRAAAGATGTRLSLRPLIFRRPDFLANLGRIAPREGGGMPQLARHSGMRRLAQARNPYSLQGLWIPGSFASLTPRNDGVETVEAL
jgi:hypothetical protein